MLLTDEGSGLLWGAVGSGPDGIAGELVPGEGWGEEGERGGGGRRK